MSRILTFCTANIPASVRYLSLYMDYSLTIAQVISKLQQESIIPEYAFNLFTFIHTPDQQDVQVRGTPLLKTSILASKTKAMPKSAAISMHSWLKTAPKAGSPPAGLPS